MSATYTVIVVSGPDHAEAIEVRDVGGEPIRLPDATLRLLAALAAGPQQLDDLVDAVWNGAPPSSANAAIHNRLSKLRRLAPGLVDRRRDLYVLSTGVAVRNDEQLGTGDERGSGEHPVRRVDAARRRSSLDPHDERVRADLIASLAAAGDRVGALDELERARADLAEVGLEPGRQLTDLARLVADGERRIERLVGDEQQTLDVGIAIGSFALDGLVATARRWMLEGTSGTLVVSGERGSGRSHALRVIRDLAISLGLGTRSIRANTFSRLPVIPVGARVGEGPTLVTVDDLDLANAATLRMVERMAHASSDRPLKLAVAIGDSAAGGDIVDRCSPGTEPTRLELRSWTDQQRRQLLDRLTLPPAQRETVDEALSRRSARGRSSISNRAMLDAVRLATGDASDRAAFDRLMATTPTTTATSLPDSLDAAMVSTMLGSLDAAGRHVVELLALTVTPILIEDLEALSPGARRQLRRREVRRLLDVDDAMGRVRTRDSVVDRVTLDHLSPRRKVDLHTTLSQADYPFEEPAVRARRLAAHGAEADLSPIEAARSVATLADAVAAAGDRLTAADISQLAADTVAAVDPRQFCELSIRAGTELLTAGDPIGLESIENALEVAVAHGLTALAARATWSYCRLGPTSGAGQVDERAAEMLAAVEPMLSDDTDLAFVLTAWTMVHTLAGDSRRCATSFDRAERHARASGSDEVMAATLPSSFMSIARPDHLERREAIALELHELAHRTGRTDCRWEALHLDFSNQLQRGDPLIRSTLDQLGEATERLDGAQHVWELTYLRAVIAQIDGDLDDALRLAELSLGAGGAVGESRRTAVFGAILLGNHLATGTVAELAPFLEQMIDDQPLLAAWRAPFALAAAELGRLDEAIEQLRWLAAPGAIEPDCTMTAVAFVAALAAATVAERTVETEHEPTARHLVDRSIELLTPWSGRWSWYGAGTYGPIDIALARLHRCLGDELRSVSLAAAAADQAARVRAPLHSRSAAELLA